MNTKSKRRVTDGSCFCVWWHKEVEWAVSTKGSHCLCLGVVFMFNSVKATTTLGLWICSFSWSYLTLLFLQKITLFPKFYFIEYLFVSFCCPSFILYSNLRLPHPRTRVKFMFYRNNTNQIREQGISNLEKNSAHTFNEWTSVCFWLNACEPYKYWCLQGQKEVIRSLELEIQVVVSFSIWVLGVEFWICRSTLILPIPHW